MIIKRFKEFCFWYECLILLGQKNAKSSSEEKAEASCYNPPNNVFVFLCEV